MSIRVQLPDGRTVNVNTDDRQKAAAAARRWAEANPKKQQASRPAPSTAKPQRGGAMSTVRDFAGDVLDNILPNWGDEYAGFWGGVGSTIDGRGYQAGYDAESRKFRERQRQYDKDHPNLAWGSTIAGTVAGAAVPAGRVAKAATTGQRVKQGAAVGAAYGAAAGAGEGNSLSERGKNAAIGSAYGAGTGAVLPAAGTGALAAGRWARRNIPGADAATRTLTAVPRAITRRVSGSPTRSAAVEQADRMLAEQMRIGNISEGHGQFGAPASPQAIAEEVARRRAMGVPAMVGDVTENMRGLTEYSSRGIGPGQALVRRHLDARKAAEPQRVRQHVQDTFPTTADPIQFVEGIQRQASEAAAPLYREAYNQPVFRNQAVQGIEQTPAFRDALPQAYRNIQNQIDPATGRPKSPEAMGFREMGNVDPNGLPPNFPAFQAADGRWIAYDRGLSTEGYDQVVRAMSDAGRQAGEINPLTGAVRNNTNSVHINARAGDLRRELTDQNDAYRQAVQQYGDDMTYRNAFEQGGDVGNLTGHEINAQARSLPEPAHQAWATGAGTAMADEASRYGAKYPNGATANRVRQMLGDETKQQAIGDVRGDPAAVSQLLDRLEAEQQGHINWQGVNGNSRTAQRQQLDNDLDAVASIPTWKVEIMNRLVNYVASRAAPQFQKELKQRIAEVVTSSGAQDVQTALRAIEAQMERDKHFADLVQRAGIGATAIYGQNIEPVFPTQEP